MMAFDLKIARSNVSRILVTTMILFFAATTFAAEVLPPAPKRYFNDYAGVTSTEVQQRLDRRLEALEKTNSTQILVAIYPKMQTDSSLEDYTVRLAQSWRVGQKAKDNGAVLFVFVQDRKMRIEVAYGLEGAIPDATAKDIIDNRITPQFRNNNYGAGLAAGVDALIQAAAGEYRGTGRTVANERSRRTGGIATTSFIIFTMLLLVAATRRRRGYVYGAGGWGGPIIWTGGSGGWSGGSGGGGGGGWSGGFSGGGGSFGGGGASGSW